MHPQTLAYNRWAESEEGLQSNDGQSLGLSKEMEIYLKNRLCRAYDAGYNDGVRAERVNIVKKIEKIILE